MAMDPAAISANPATTMMRVVVSAPDNPAARANGTVRPSAIPMTMSRTNSEAVKCDSTCGVCGIFFQVSPSVGIPGRRNLLGRSLSHDLSAPVAAFGSQVDHPSGAAHHVQVVFDDQDTSAVLDQALECRQQFRDVVEVQAGGGLVEDEQRPAAGRLRQMGCQFHTLGFASTKRGGGLPETQVSQAHVGQNFQAGYQPFGLGEER